MLIPATQKDGSLGVAEAVTESSSLPCLSSPHCRKESPGKAPPAQLERRQVWAWHR